MSNPPNYFEDFDESKADQLEEEIYDDSETFGDSGPLNNEWESGKDLLSEERNQFLQSNKIERKHYEIDPDDEDDEDEENDNTFGGDSNKHNQHHHNGNGNHFFSSTTTTTTTQQFQTTRKVTGVFNSLSLEDDNNQIDEESVFKIAMGESAFDSLTQLQQLKQQPQQPMNPLQKLMSIIPQDSVQNNNTNNGGDGEILKSRFSVSDLEAKYINSSSGATTTTTTTTVENLEDEQLITPSKLNKQPQAQQAQNTADYSPSKQQYYKNKFSRPPPITLGDMVQQTSTNQQQTTQNTFSHNNNNNMNIKQQNTKQYTNSPNKQYKNKNNYSSNSNGDKKYMTAEEIQSIIRLQSYQIHFTNPYIEDYYYQRYKMKSSIPTHTHTPICDSQPKSVPLKKPLGTNTVDPLSGALGRIPSHSIRAPRQILQIILNNSGAGEGEQGNGQDKSQNSDQTIKLVVESAYSHVLDLEDLNILISLNQQDQQLLSEFTSKRDIVSASLFSSLHLDPFPCFKFESPQLPHQDASQKWPSVCPEDLLFVSLWVLAKGRKLLNRAFPLLTAQQSYSGLFAVCRNLPLLLLLHLPEGSEISTQGIYITAVKWIMEIPIKYFILGFHFLVNFNQGKFIVKLMTDSKEGRSIVHAFLARGTLLQDPNYRARGINIEPIDMEQWREVFDRFFSRLSNNFIAIFPPTNNPPMELSQLFSFIFANSNEKQRQSIQFELSKY